MVELDLVLGVASAFAIALVVGSLRSRRAYRETAGTRIDAPIALDIARYHRRKWLIVTALAMAGFMLIATLHLAPMWTASSLTFVLAAGTACTRADFMLCALDHPDVQLSVSEGFVHGTAGHTLIAWLPASPQLVQKIAGTHLPAARLR